MEVSLSLRVRLLDFEELVDIGRGEVDVLEFQIAKDMLIQLLVRCRILLHQLRLEL